MSSEKATIALLAIPEVAASALYGMYDIFASAGRDWAVLVDGVPGSSPLVPSVVARSGAQRMSIANGVQIVPDADLGAIPEVVCIPEVALAPGTELHDLLTPEINWIWRCHEAGSVISTACSGALLLAETGLLNGHDATTHWAYCDALARYPGVSVHPQRALVVGGEGNRLVMAGGGTSWADLALYLVGRLVGVEEAMQLAKLFLIDWHDIGQLPYAMLAKARQSEDPAIAACQTWIAQHYDEAAPVKSMIRVSQLSERTFHRRFKQATGLSPLDYVHTLRLEEAKHMLETGTDTLEAIAEDVGYEDTAFFGHLFRRKVGITPTQYRRRFGGLRQALTT